MDLSNLSNNLPHVKSLEKVSLLDINRELINEFKNTAKAVASLYNSSSPTENGDKNLKAEFADAAKAVASLYRTGNNSNVLLMHKGYLDCLDDLLQIITSGEDIENWALTKRAELTNFYTSNSTRALNKGKEQDKTPDVITTDTTAQEQEDLGAGIPEYTAHDKIELADIKDQDVARFTLPAHHEFLLPEELLSHTVFRPSFAPLSVTYKKSKRRLELKKTKMPISLQDSSPSSDYDSEETNTDIEVRKKRKNHISQEASKRRKRGSGSDNDGLYP